jgi:hypothetical protein
LIRLDHDRQNYDDAPKETAQVRKDDDMSAGTVQIAEHERKMPKLLMVQTYMHALRVLLMGTRWRRRANGRTATM